MYLFTLLFVLWMPYQRHRCQVQRNEDVALSALSLLLKSSEFLLLKFVP